MKECSCPSIQPLITGPKIRVVTNRHHGSPMNPMLFGLTKLATLIAVFVFSAGMPQASACKCSRCPSKIDGAAIDASVVSAHQSAANCCCETAFSTNGQPCPCECEQVKPDQGLERQSELLQWDLASEQLFASQRANQSLSRAVAHASPVEFFGASICVALCRFRL